MAHSDYHEQRQWSDRYIPEIKRIVGPYLLEESSFEIDTQQAADLVVVQARNLTIACRVRREKYGLHHSYRHQFTIRSQNNGHKTELQKITEGWGDWMFYGFGADKQVDLFRWYLINLHSWRAHMIRNRNQITYGQTPNGDGTYFTWFDLHTFPAIPPILIASSHSCEFADYQPALFAELL